MRTLTAAEDLDQLSTDAGVIRLKPKVGLVAESEEDVVRGVSEGQLRGLPVTARGGGTSIPSQSVGKGVILLQRRDRVELRRDGCAVVQPAAVKSDLNKKLAAEGRWMPVDPSSYASCTVGGMVANNSSGVRTMKYGSTVDFVEGLRAVFPGGAALPLAPMPLERALEADPRTKRVASLLLENQRAIAEDRRAVTKNSSGYRLERALHDGLFDMPRLLVGSEGTLCVFTEVTLRTILPPRWRLLLIVESTLDELDEVARAFGAHSPSALELVDKSVFRTMNRWDRVSKYSRSDDPFLVFCEYDGQSGESAIKAEELAGSKAGGYDPLVLTSATEISEAWEVRSETLTLAQDIRKGTRILVPGVEDLVVPPDRLSDLVKLLIDQFGRRGLEYISYGHAGDANLHARPLLDLSELGGTAILGSLMEDCFEAVWKMGGSMTGEHGDGMLRAKFVERQYPKSYWIMKEVKELFDPNGLLNPGVKIAGSGRL